MSRTKVTSIIIGIVLILSIIAYVAVQQSRHLKRDIPTLLNHYYQLEKKQPWKAKEALELIIAQDPDHIMATRLLASWYLRQGDTYSALAFLEKSHQRFPDDPVIRNELANLYILLNKPEAARTLLAPLISAKESAEQKKARRLYQKISEPAAVQVVKLPGASYIEPVDSSYQPLLSPLYQRAEEAMLLQPEEARQYLHFILSLNPNAYTAHQKLGYLEIRLLRPQVALEHFIKAFAIQKTPGTALQIAYLYAGQKQFPQAMEYFSYALKYGSPAQQQQSHKAIAYLQRVTTPLTSVVPSVPVPMVLSLKAQELNAFFSSKHSNPAKAWTIITRLMRLYPHDLAIWKEAAYFAIAQKQTTRALEYWRYIYSQEAYPEHALQIAYLYDTLGDRKNAFYYFSRAARTTDSALRYKAEIAMTNIGGAHTKLLPAPYFLEFYTAPFYFSRFDLGVLPTITRAGMQLNTTHQSELYLSHRRTSDNRSGTPESRFVQTSISQIFEDNVAIYSVGFRTRPWTSVPLVTFIEAGRAEDLVQRDRRKWRNDLRGGLLYYNEWGAKPTYTNDLEFPFQWRTTLYADTIYFSRYDHNIIGTAWFRPGFRIATFQSASLDVYLANYLVLDKNREFFNNIYSLGPGVAFQPSNRLNVKLRLEAQQAYYIPVNSPTPNPFRSRFYNNIVLIEGYFLF
ncbi:MAG: tetratricopeptide repeat protein [Legionellaceae bacterium]|nr:tetratricopeptide repeat protein [Legionellaceae bacterium]